MNQPTADNQSIIEDLAAQNAAEIKGGPNPKNKRTLVLQSSVEGGVAEVQTITITGSASNHNETVAADEAEDDAAETARLTDLAVNAAQSDEVKGGSGRPSISAVVIPPFPRGSN